MACWVIQVISLGWLKCVCTTTSLCNLRPTSATRVYVYENWAGTADLAAHLAGPYYAQMLALLGKYEVTDAVVSKFKVALEEPVYDPEGKPRADFFTE